MWRSNTSFMGTSTSVFSPAVKSAEPLSQQRQKLNRLTANYAEQAQKALALREVMKGSVYRLQTRCGCPSCHCAQPDGARHSAMVLSWTQGGRSRRLRSVRPAPPASPGKRKNEQPLLTSTDHESGAYTRSSESAAAGS